MFRGRAIGHKKDPIDPAREWARCVFKKYEHPEPGPQWTKRDKEWAIALAMEEMATHTCGQPIAESFSSEFEDAYVAEGQRCHACAAMSHEVERVTDQAGLSVSVRKRDE